MKIINSPCIVCEFKDYEYLPRDLDGYIKVRCKKCGSFPYKIGGSQNSVELKTLNLGYVDRRKKELIKKAKEKKLFTYEEFGELFGYDMSNVDERNKLADDIGDISRYEHRQGRPMLSVLVVHKNPGRESIKMPGEGFFKLASELRKKEIGIDDKNFFFKELKEVYEYWKGDS